jgi:hypothetical protein
MRHFASVRVPVMRAARRCSATESERWPFLPFRTQNNVNVLHFSQLYVFLAVRPTGLQLIPCMALSVLPTIRYFCKQVFCRPNFRSSLVVAVTGRSTVICFRSGRIFTVNMSLLSNFVLTVVYVPSEQPFTTRSRAGSF